MSTFYITGVTPSPIIVNGIAPSPIDISGNPSGAIVVNGVGQATQIIATGTVAAQGPQGATGPTGATGPAGTPGPSDHTLLSNIGTNTHAQIDTAITASISHIASVANPHSVTKTQVGLPNVDNTSDANKPVSTATQTALDAKQATLVSATNIKTINGTTLLGSGDLVVAGGGGATNLTTTAAPTNVTINSDTGTDAIISATDVTNAGLLLPAEKTKLAGIATGATANDTDANLKARANHTGTQTAATISDFSTAADARITAAAGVSLATLSSGKIPSSQIPAVSLVTVQTAASQVAQLALTTQEGDVVVRTDTNVTYMRNAGVAGTMADFTLLNTPTDAVTSVNTQTGAVVLSTTNIGEGTNLYYTNTRADARITAATGVSVQGYNANTTTLGNTTTGTGSIVRATSPAITTPTGIVKGDVGLSNVDNTSDASKPVSTAQATAIALKENTITAGTTSQYYRGDKSFQTLDKTAVGLPNVDNTSDANKPVSTAQATAIALKQNTVALTTTGTSGAATFNAGTGALNIPNYAGGSSSPATFTTAGTVKQTVYNIRDYGAVGDGTTNDTAAIQSAITAAQTGLGGTVYIPSGTYLINATLNITTDITVKGSSWQSIIKIANASNIFAFTFTPGTGDYIDGAKFSDFKIDCNNTNQTTAGGGIYAKGAVWCVFDHLWITKPYENAIELLDDNLGGYGHHNTVTNSLFDLGQSSPSGSGRAIKLNQSDENYIAFNSFQDNGRSGATEPNHIYDLAGLNSFVNNSFVGGQTGLKLQGEHNRAIGNVFDGGSNHQIRVNGAKNLITGNHFYKVGAGSSGANYDGVYLDNVTETIITSNIFEASSGTNGSRYAINFAFGAAGNLVTNNSFVTAGTWGTDKVSNVSTNTVYENIGLTGNIPVTEFNGGTSASSATYLRGDGVWATPSGGGSAITVKDEAVNLTTALTSLDFAGAGVTATNTGGAVTVTIPGGSGSGDMLLGTAQTVTADKTLATNTSLKFNVATNYIRYDSSEGKFWIAAGADNAILKLTYGGASGYMQWDQFGQGERMRLDAGGRLKLATGGTVETPEIKITGGTPGVGKVLTDDGTGTGVGVWTTPSGGGFTGGTVTGDIEISKAIPKLALTDTVGAKTWQLKTSSNGDNLQVTSPNNATLLEFSNSSDTASMINMRANGKYNGAVPFRAVGSSGQSVNLLEIDAGAGTIAGFDKVGGVFGRSVTTAYVEKTAAYTVTNLDSTINATSGTFTLTLPTAVGITGRQYTIKNSGTGVITVDAAGTETIDGGLTAVLSTQYASITIQSTGANWIII